MATVGLGYVQYNFFFFHMLPCFFLDFLLLSLAASSVQLLITLGQQLGGLLSITGVPFPRQQGG